MSNDEIDELFLGLRREYLIESASQMAELRAQVAAFSGGASDALRALKAHFHRLAGSGGSYGFPHISSIAKETELWIGTDPPSGPETVARLNDAIGRLEAELQSRKA